MAPSRGRLAGKVALVTGASSGIGAATAKALVREGMRVALLARRKDRLEAVAEEIRRGGGHALVSAADVTNATAVQATVHQVLGQWMRIDCLVNNAGRGLAAPFQATSADEFRALLELNLMSRARSCAASGVRARRSTRTARRAYLQCSARWRRA